MAKPGDTPGVEEQPEPLAGLDPFYQKRVHDPDVIVARADELRVAFLNETDVLTGRESFRRRHWSDSDVDGIPPPIPVPDQLAELWSLVHK